MCFSKGWAGKRQIFLQCQSGASWLVSSISPKKHLLGGWRSLGCQWQHMRMGTITSEGAPPPLKAVQVVGTTWRHPGPEGNICQWSADGVLAVRVPFTCQVDPVTRDRCLESQGVLGTRSWSTRQIKALAYSIHIFPSRALLEKAKLPCLVRVGPVGLTRHGSLEQDTWIC